MFFSTIRRFAAILLLSVVAAPAITLAQSAPPVIEAPASTGYYVPASPSELHGVFGPVVEAPLGTYTTAPSYYYEPAQPLPQPSATPSLLTPTERINNQPGVSTGSVTVRGNGSRVCIGRVCVNG